MIGGRRKWSASQPIGSAPSTRNALDAPARNTMTPSLTPNASRMSGASTPSVADSSSSSDVSTSSTTNVERPPVLESLAQRQLLVADTGEQVVGEEHRLLRRRLLRLALGLGVEHRDREVRCLLGRPVGVVGDVSDVARAGSAHCRAPDLLGAVLELTGSVSVTSCLLCRVVPGQVHRLRERVGLRVVRDRPRSRHRDRSCLLCGLAEARGRQVLAGGLRQLDEER